MKNQFAFFNLKTVNKILLFFSSVLMVGACTHGPSNQAKNSSPTAFDRAPASQTHLEQDDQDRIKNIILNEDATHFMQILVELKAAQVLVSSFDVRLSQISKESEMDSLFGSNLYCKLWKVYGLHEHAEEQITFAMAFIKSLEPKYTDWAYSQMSAFAKLDMAHEAAMANLFRGLADNEISICGREKCISEDLTKLQNIHVNPLDNKDFSRFMNENKGSIAQFTGIKETDLQPGDCFKQQTQRKPQSAGFDWVNRNWVGSVLPAGQFVFTYDDGPHASYTRMIRDTWQDAGMPKPAFFWLRQNASHLPDIVKELNQQNYVIGSHSERHADLGNLAKANSAADFNGVNKQIFGPEVKAISAADFAGWKNKTLDREINQSVADLSAILGKPVRYFRLPFGSGVKNDLIGSRFEALDLDHFFWRVDSLDWQDKNPESIRDRVVAQMNTVKKGIVLFHDIHPQSAQAAKLMVDYLKTSTTYKAVSIHDIPGLKP